MPTMGWLRWMFPVEPWMLSNNTFDIAHLRALHRLAQEEESARRYGIALPVLLDCIAPGAACAPAAARMIPLAPIRPASTIKIVRVTGHCPSVRGMLDIYRK